MSKSSNKFKVQCQKDIVRERLFNKKKLTKDQIDWVTKKE